MQRTSAFSLSIAVSLILTLTPSGGIGSRPGSGPEAVGKPSVAESGIGALDVTRTEVSAALNQLPLVFVENKGQLDERVAYQVQGSDKRISFAPEGVTFTLTEGDPQPPSPYRPPSLEGDRDAWAVTLDFLGADPDVRPVGEDRTEATVSYFQGAPDAWHVGLPTYSRIVYRNLWPGIDLMYHGTVSQLKYEFVVHPGADPDQIRLAYRGATEVALNGDGQMEVTTPLGGFTDEAPVAYQAIESRRVPVEAGYRLAPSGGRARERISFRGRALDLQTVEFGFAVGSYDASRSLIIDPAVLVTCGYIGVSSEGANDIALDGEGHAYVAGSTLYSDATEPLAGGPLREREGGAFVAKVRADGSGLVYAGHIGGGSLHSIAVDEVGHAYVTGYTYADETLFPVVGGPDLTFNGGRFDAFVAKLEAGGSGLVYAGYIGGDDDDYGHDIAVDREGHAYVTGSTLSSEASFPVVGGPDLTHEGGGMDGDSDVFVVKVRPDGSRLAYAGYIGGKNTDYGTGIAVDSQGSAYVTGWTWSQQDTFPVVVGPDLRYNQGYRDAFVAKVTPDGGALSYCGYIGSEGRDEAYDIAVDGDGSAYVVGWTSSDETTFPVAVGPDLSHNGDDDVFVVKVRPDGSGLTYAGYIGGAGGDWGEAIAVDEAGNAYVTGRTASDETSFPVLSGPDLTYNGGKLDAFVAKVRADGSGLLYAGYIGGAERDEGSSIAVDGAGSAYITGATRSDESTFPVVGGPDLTYNAGETGNAFLAQVSGEDATGGRSATSAPAAPEAEETVAEATPTETRTPEVEDARPQEDSSDDRQSEAPDEETGGAPSGTDRPSSEGSLQTMGLVVGIAGLLLGVTGGAMGALAGAGRPTANRLGWAAAGIGLVLLIVGIGIGLGTRQAPPASPATATDQAVGAEPPTRTPTTAETSQPSATANEAPPTQIAPTDAPTPIPATATLIATPTPDPLVACAAAPQQGLQAGDQVVVCTKSDRLRVRRQPHRGAAEAHLLDPGTALTIIGGPACADDWLWWQVETAAGQTGWVAEGGDEIDPYFICRAPACEPVTGAFSTVWPAVEQEIGCPTGAVFEGLVAEEHFEGGIMIWREAFDQSRSPVLFNDGTWRYYRHSPFVEGSAEFSCVDENTPAQCPPTPKRGFGMMWCKNPELRARLGNAVTCERGYQGTMQTFANGFMLQNDEGTTYVLFDTGTWRRVR